MPKITKKGSYNLNDSFSSTIVEANYTQNDFKDLIMWVQPDSTTALIDGSSFNHTIVETGLVSVGQNRITDQGYEQAFSSVNFNGTTSQFRVADADVFSFTDGANNDKPFSASIWVRFTNLLQVQGLFGKAASTSTREYFASVTTTGAIAFQLFDESTNHAITKTSINGVVVANTWHHVVVTYDGSEGHAGIDIYVDGVLTTSQSAATGGSYAGSENLGSSFFVGLGMDTTGSGTLRYLKGDVGGFALWSKKLASTAVTALYHRKGYNAYRSGFLNNPVRTIIRDSDNRAGAYPTIHRMNRKDNTGILSNIVFDDTKTVKFGNVIKDDFTIEEEAIYSKAVDSNLWKVSNTEVLVRKEFDPRSDLELTTGAVVLGGPGDASGRWLQTAKKVKNATLIFSLLQGPYNNTGALARFKLNLGKGALTDVFKVQVSSDETNWVDIGLKNIHLGTNDVWVDSLIINEASKHVVPRDVFELRRVFTALGSPNVGDQFKPILNFKIDMKDIAATGIRDDVYIRFIQPSISDTNITVWAIGAVNIIARNERVIYPYLGPPGNLATLYHLSQSIATPNFINSLISPGASVSGITDSSVLPFSEQLNTPFDEKVVVDSNNSGFFSAGVQENIIPGFGRPLTSKTQFNFQMKPAEDDVIAVGLTRTGTGAPTGLNNDDGQILLSYWNFKRNAWEEIGQPLRDNRGNHASQAAAKAHLDDNITGSCAGFGPIIDSLTFGPAGQMKLASPKAFEHAFLPTSTFGFPFAAKYHATSSQYVKASDLGITKPFLLEKITLDFDIEFAVPGHNVDSDKDRDAFTTIHIDETNNTLNPYQNRRLKIFTPTFFLLRQHLDSKSANINSFSVSTPGALGFPKTVLETIPKEIKLTPGSNVKTTIYDTRELITYGQYNLFITASKDTQSSFPDRLNDSGITMTDLLDSGIVRDGFSVKAVTECSVDAIYSVSDKINFPVRIPGQHTGVSSVIVHNNNPSGPRPNISLISLENKSASRKLSMDGSARAIVNGVAGLKRSNEFLIVSQSAKVASVSTFENLTFESPYLILPEDEIIFGWQYPMPRDLRFPQGTVSSTPNSMKVQDCKVKMFGSQIRNNKEFHEGLNQNLTSNAVHEVIGNEPIVDQFQISTRGELTGSLADHTQYITNAVPPGQNPFEISSLTGVEDVFAIGALIAPPEDTNTTAVNQLSYLRGNDPIKRINGTFFFVGNFQRSSFSILNDSHNVIVKALDNLNLGGKLPANSYQPQLQRFLRLVDLDREFKDATILNSESDKTTTTYGSAQNYSYPSGGDAIVKLGGSPRYYFNNRHYGHFSDFIRQGLDGRFTADIQSIRNRVVFEPAIRVKFVEDDYDEENLNFRKFSLIKAADVDGTAYETFQSSNISLFATSSLPFKEGKKDSIDDDTPTNRTYSVTAVEVT